MGQPIRMCAGVISKETPCAQVPVVPSGPVGGVDLDQLVVLRLDCDLTAVPAEGTDCIRSLEHPRPVFVHGQSARDGADRANLDAPTAKLAVERMWAEMLDLRHCAATGRGQGLHVHDLIAVADAPQALHAAVHLSFDERAEIFFLEYPLRFDEAAGGCRVLV